MVASALVSGELTRNSLVLTSLPVNSTTGVFRKHQFFLFDGSPEGCISFRAAADGYDTLIFFIGRIQN